MVRKYDYLVIGSGVAGMSFALKVAKTGTVALVCKSKMEEANTDLAQGGVATVTNLEVDNFEKHIHDTMVAGDWLSDPEAVKKVVTEAPAQIQELLGWGVDFDKNEKGEFDLHREGGHSEFRILHHADNTGHEIQVSLIETVRNNPNIDIYELLNAAVNGGATISEVSLAVGSITKPCDVLVSLMNAGVKAGP